MSGDQIFAADCWDDHLSSSRGGAVLAALSSWPELRTPVQSSLEWTSQQQYFLNSGIWRKLSIDVMRTQTINLTIGDSINPVDCGHSGYVIWFTWWHICNQTNNMFKYTNTVSTDELNVCTIKKKEKMNLYMHWKSNGCYCSSWWPWACWPPLWQLPSRPAPPWPSSTGWCSPPTSPIYISISI